MTQNRDSRPKTTIKRRGFIAAIAAMTAGVSSGVWAMLRGRRSNREATTDSSAEQSDSSEPKPPKWIGHQ